MDADVEMILKWDAARSPRSGQKERKGESDAVFFHEPLAVQRSAWFLSLSCHWKL